MNENQWDIPVMEEIVTRFVCPRPCTLTVSGIDKLGDSFDSRHMWKMDKIAWEILVIKPISIYNLDMLKSQMIHSFNLPWLIYSKQFNIIECITGQVTLGALCRVDLW